MKKSKIKLFGHGVNLFLIVFGLQAIYGHIKGGDFNWFEAFYMTILSMIIILVAMYYVTYIKKK